MEFKTDKAQQITARKLMELMLYDNGCISGCEPDRAERYFEKDFKAITKACELFFDKYPDLLTDDNLEQIACGDYDTTQEMFGKYIGFSELENALYDYFEKM